LSHDLSQPKYNSLELKIGRVIINREYLWFIYGLQVKTIIIWPLRKIVNLFLRPLRPYGNLALKMRVCRLHVTPLTSRPAFTLLQRRECCVKSDTTVEDTPGASHKFISSCLVVDLKLSVICTTADPNWLPNFLTHETFYFFCFSGWPSDFLKQLYTWTVFVNVTKPSLFCHFSRICLAIFMLNMKTSTVLWKQRHKSTICFPFAACPTGKWEGWL
jgi:hypothetical protein